MNRTAGKQGKRAAVKRQRAVTLSQDPETGENGKSDAAALPPAPGPGATHHEWLVWGEAITKAAKLAGYSIGDRG